MNMMNFTNPEPKVSIFNLLVLINSSTTLNVMC